MRDGRIHIGKERKARSKGPGERAPRCVEEHSYVVMTVLVKHLNALLEQMFITLHRNSTKVLLTSEQDSSISIITEVRVREQSFK